MNALAKIRSAGFELWLKDNGNIGIRPFDALTPQQLEFLKVHKAEIIEALAANDDRRPRLNSKDKTAILAWLHFIGETDQALIDDVLDYCAGNPDALAYYLKRAEEVPPPDDRHHCRECRNLNSRGYCIRHRFRPVDDIPRRCEDFRADAPSTIQGITHD
ncbi:hypothetical protein [Methylosarcina fibrata]|uniref:hypothetical protein n=1 Tax=Methylosarcina fibrata TaxID=105972 RepID=UPI000365A612|nr:hypothetical protein [Methylosarcina fibrata]